LRRGHIAVTNGLVHDALIAAVHADPGPIVGGPAVHATVAPRSTT
jgi:hypothetical protein